MRTHADVKLSTVKNSLSNLYQLTKPRTNPCVIISDLELNPHDWIPVFIKHNNYCVSLQKPLLYIDTGQATYHEVHVGKWVGMRFLLYKVIFSYETWI